MNLKIFVLTLFVYFVSGANVSHTVEYSDQDTIKSATLQRENELIQGPVNPAVENQRSANEDMEIINSDSSTVNTTLKQATPTTTTKATVSVNDIPRNKTIEKYNNVSLNTTPMPTTISSPRFTTTTAATTTTSTSTTTTTTTTTAATTTTTTTTTSTTPTITSAPPTSITLKNGVIEEGIWNVRDSNNIVCIAVKMELNFNVTYPGNKDNVQNTTINIPKNANVTGSCSNTSQTITLEWGDGNSFQVNFSLNTTEEKFRITLFNLSVNTSTFQNINGTFQNMTFLSARTEIPATPVRMSYKCDKLIKQTLNFTENNMYSAVLLASHTQLEAFMNNKEGRFGEAQDCEGLDTPDIVPVAVGCVLSILVVLVLVAYLIGRRTQNRGYLSI